MGLLDKIKRVASDTEALAHADIKGRQEVGSAIRAAKANVTRYVEKKKEERAATRTAKSEQKYQDFEREHLSEPAKARKEAEKAKEELEDVKDERKTLREELRADRYRKVAKPKRYQRLAKSHTRKATTARKVESFKGFQAGSIGLSIGSVSSSDSASVKSAGLGNVGSMFGINSSGKKRRKGNGSNGVFDFF